MLLSIEQAQIRLCKNLVAMHARCCEIPVHTANTYQQSEIEPFEEHEANQVTSNCQHSRLDPASKYNRQVVSRAGAQLYFSTQTGNFQLADNRVFDSISYELLKLWSVQHQSKTAAAAAQTSRPVTETAEAAEQNM